MISVARPGLQPRISPSLDTFAKPRRWSLSLGGVSTWPCLGDNHRWSGGSWHRVKLPSSVDFAACWAHRPGRQAPPAASINSGHGAEWRPCAGPLNTQRRRCAPSQLPWFRPGRRGMCPLSVAAREPYSGLQPIACCNWDLPSSDSSVQLLSSVHLTGVGYGPRVLFRWCWRHSPTR